MLYKRYGFPEQDEIVLCKVTKIYPNSVFVELLEYGRSGIIHISEVSPGRIRNLRDYVKIDRQIVCKVLRLDKDKGHIDLSLRRVHSTQRREKLDEIKGELKAESLVKNLAKKLNTTTEKLYKQLSDTILKEYHLLYFCFRDVVSGEVNLEKLGLDKNVAKELKEAILEKFKPKRITIQGEVQIKTYHPDGVERIKKTLTEIETVSNTLKLFYLGGGRYKVILEDFDYKPAEINLKKVQDILQKFEDKLSTASFERDKNE